MNDKKNLMFEELESVEELGAFYDGWAGSRPPAANLRN